MSDAIRREPLVAAVATPRAIQSIYPEPFAFRTKSRGFALAIRSFVQ